LEIVFVTKFYWSVKDIDETDMESMIDFINRFGSQGGSKPRKAYCDEVDWL
jgi:hypothetical protein